VREGVLDEVEDVVVGEAVEDVLADAAADDELLGAEQAELLGDGGEAGVGGLGQLGDAPLSAGEAGEQTEPGHVTGGAEDGRRALEGLVGRAEVNRDPG